MVIYWFGVLLLEGCSIGVIQCNKVWFVIGGFVVVIMVVVVGLVYFQVVLVVCVIFYVVIGLVSGSDVYIFLEWKVIVFLGFLILFGQVFEQVGNVQIIVDGIIMLMVGVLVWVIFIVFMIVIMILLDFFNNVVICLIVGLILVQIVNLFGVNFDFFLMVVVVVGLCVFLILIGYKNNIIIMGFGGYWFGDYWWIGLFLEGIVLIVVVLVILVFWLF